MTEQKKRTSADVQTDFNNLAFRAGHLQKDIHTKKKELNIFNDTLDSLQVEYNTLLQQEKEVQNALKAKAAEDAAKAAAEAAAAAPKDNVTQITEGKKE